MANNHYVGSEAANEASDYFNSLPYEEKAKLAPLLDHYRQMGLAEACGHLDRAAAHIAARITGIRKTDYDVFRKERNDG